MKQNIAMIQRNALLDSIESFSKRIIYLCAPAGYGKSVFSQNWLHKKDESCAFISFDRYDNNPINFSRRFCRALMTIEPDNKTLYKIVHHSSFGSAPDEFTIRAIESLDPASPVRLAMDDLHVIDNNRILNLLYFYLTHLPANFQILIASREQPPKIFSDFILKDLLMTITASDLSFNAEDILDLYNKRGLLITPKQAKTIHSITGGWAIGINALLLSGGKNADDQLMSQHLETFIEEQVWGNWDKNTQDFMLETALEEELTPSLCEALTGNPKSGQILEEFIKTNSFVLKGQSGSYFFHSLFRDFLLSKLENEDVFKKRQHEKAALWYEQNGAYLKALDSWLHVDDEEKTLNCLLNFLGSAGKNFFFIEKMLPLLQNPSIKSIMERNVYLLAFAAWTNFLNGNPNEMEYNADCFYEAIPDMMIHYPQFAAQIYYLRLLDYRRSLHQMLVEIANTPPTMLPTMAPGVGTITQNMAIVHRSSRDFSEYAHSGEIIRKGLYELKNTFGMLIGEEQNLFESCIVGGLLYEQGNLTEAHQHALLALSEIKDSFTPESKFCAMSLLVHILNASWQFDRAELMIRQIEDMIDKDKAYFLSFQMASYLCMFKLANGDVESAADWLENYGTDPFEHIPFHRVYGFFTTARAHIVLGNYDKAIVILSKILELVQAYKRPLDIIESKILISIAFWKKKRNHQSKALDYLEEAILLAELYGYTQLFINEGADVANMLHRLQNRASRSNYTGELPGKYTRMIYLRAKIQATYSKGLTGGRNPEPVSFTKKQETIMRLLSNGYTFRQIAEELNIKFSTVRSHIELIYKKLDVPNEVEAIMKIKEMNL